MPPRRVLIRDPHGRFDTRVLRCTDGTAAPDRIVAWFVLRWQLEVTFEETRRHLGVETQRQWSDRAIQRTTPALLGLCSLTSLLAQPQMLTANHGRQAAWYHTPLPTFADALTVVRRQRWGHTLFCTSPASDDVVEVPRVLVERLADALCYAA